MMNVRTPFIATPVPAPMSPLGAVHSPLSASAARQSSFVVTSTTNNRSFRVGPTTLPVGVPGTPCHHNKRVSPRKDINLRVQRSSVKAAATLKKEAWVADCEAETVEFSSGLVYHRHAFKTLVVEARRRQQRVKRHRAQQATSGAAPPALSPRSSADRSNKEDVNCNNLLRDVDVLMRLASDKDKDTQQRIVTSTMDQLGKLALWKRL